MLHENPNLPDFAHPPIRLEPGQPYPLRIAVPEGAAALFLSKSRSVLQITLPGMDSKEEAALRKGKLRAGLLVADGAILLLFQFFGSIRSPTLTFDCRFDIRELPAAERDSREFRRRTRPLHFEVHALDEQGILRVFRRVSLPSRLTDDFLSAAASQLMSKRSGETAYMLWNRREPQQLVAQCDMQICDR